MVLPWCPSHVKVYESVQPFLQHSWIFLSKIYLWFEIKKHLPCIHQATLILSVCSLRKLSPPSFSSESHTPAAVSISALLLELSSIRFSLHISNSGTVRTDTSLKIDVSSRYGTCTHCIQSQILLCVCFCLLEFTKWGLCVDKLGEKLCEPSLGEFIQFYCIIALWNPWSYKGT